MSKNRILIFFALIVLIGLFSVYYKDIKETTGKAIVTKEEGLLLRVIDGDTIEAKIDNEIWKIRMLGINTPEKNMPHANSAKDFLKQFENRTIILESDEEDVDKYNRKLRYIYYDSRFLNLEIIERGFANTYYLDNLRYKEDFLRAENQARNLELGIWEKSDEICSTENCIKLKELNYEEEYFIVENICSFNCNLKGWFVKDKGRNTFYLSSLEAGEEQRYNSTKEVWNNLGDSLFIFDEKGMIVLEYSY
jgi:micrococcal nuclease